MTATLEFFIDVGSPAAYLAFTQMSALAQRTGAQVVYRPFLLGGAMKATGNSPPMTVPAKGANMRRDLARFAEYYGVPFAHNPFFPISTLTIMRGAAACAATSTPGAALERYLQVLFKAMWVDQHNLGDEAVLRQVLTDGGLDADAVLASTQQPEVKQALMANTEEAVRRGVFGAPSFFVGDELFFGQDRLPIIEHYLKRASA